MRSKQVTVLLVFVVQSLFHSFNAVAQVAVRGETVYTMAGEPIKDGVVVITDGKIVEVGPASAVQIPDGHRTLTAKVVTPGLVDAHTVVGLTGYMNQDQDQDQLERSGPIHPELRAIDAYNPQERLVQWLREFGITTIHTGHAPGLPLSGQTMIAKTTGETVEEAVRVPTAMLAVTLGRDAAGKTKGKEATPGTRAKVMAVLRAELIKAQDYTRKLETAKEDKKPSRDLRLEMLARVLDGEVRLLITAHKAHDIISALRLAREFDLKIVLDGAAEAYMVLDKIKQAGVPVIIHPTMTRAFGERKNLSMETAAKLKEAGIPFALQSGYESYVPKTRVV
ncbi:MAG: amidohydrolase, partial [Planctomycetes bacterium]|nr:amidohydrolase [Planctomycetota bacterium]